MKPITSLTIAFLALLALMQLTRLLAGWSVVIAGVVVPLWASGLVAALAAGLAVLLWREARSAR